MKLIICPLPINQDELLLITWYSCLIPLHKDEKIWCWIVFPFLRTLLLTFFSQSYFEWIMSQPCLRLASSLRHIRDLIPKHPSKGAETFFQATVKSFFLDISPLKMNFFIQCSKVFRIETRQEYTDKLWISMLWIIVRCHNITCHKIIYVDSE